MGNVFSVDQWHQRFSVQADWTKELRKYIYNQIAIYSDSRILEVGCGTGVITSELCEMITSIPTGIDLDLDRLIYANKNDPRTNYCDSDVYHLPFSSNSFDFVLSHYFFLWLKHPAIACQEILRILKPGGFLVALAEPDYEARIDSPEEMERMGKLQTQSLVNQGINPKIGRQLPYILHKSGFQDVQYGISGYQDALQNNQKWIESEWQVLRNDLQSLTSEETITNFIKQDQIFREKCSRLFWLPTFYIYGKK